MKSWEAFTLLGKGLFLDENWNNWGDFVDYELLTDDTTLEFPRGYEIGGHKKLLDTAFALNFTVAGMNLDALEVLFPGTVAAGACRRVERSDDQPVPAAPAYTITLANAPVSTIKVYDRDNLEVFKRVVGVPAATGEVQFTAPTTLTFNVADASRRIRAQYAYIDAVAGLTLTMDITQTPGAFEGHLMVWAMELEQDTDADMCAYFSSMTCINRPGVSVAQGGKADFDIGFELSAPPEYHHY